MEEKIDKKETDKKLETKQSTLKWGWKKEEKDNQSSSKGCKD